MNRFFLTLASVPRLFPGGLRVRNVGYVPNRDTWNDWSRAVRRDVDVSFYLRGTGSARAGARQWRIVSPCALVKPPSLPIRYGPDSAWDEFYVDFALDQGPALRRLGLLHGPPVRPLRHPERVAHLMLSIDEARDALYEAGGADRLDRLCELLLFEVCFRAERPPSEAAHEPALLAVRAHLECHASERISPDRVAREHGLSPATFRRLWNQRYPACTPARFLMRVRMEQACRLLADTDLPIKAVAARLGFADPCYFMKVFHRHTGLTAGHFRAARRSARAGSGDRGP